MDAKARSMQSVVGLILAPAVGSWAQDRIDISGKVVDAATKDPIAGAQVRLSVSGHDMGFRCGLPVE